MTAIPPEVVRVLAGGRRVALLAHVYPDGDVLGSQLGLGLALRAAGRQVVFGCAHAVPEPFHFLPGAREVEARVVTRPPCDLAITLDTPDPSRVGGLLDACREAGARVLNIDHHPDNRRYGDVNWIEREAAAVGEMVYELILAAKLPLGPDVATNLYTAIVTDTGSFRYSNTTPRTFRTAAQLVERGADPSSVATALYETRQLPGLRLLGALLTEVEASDDGAIAWLTIDAGRMLSRDLPEGEEFVNYPRSLRTAKVAVLFRELPGATKVSLRAKGEVDVARVAARFGGGGHANAAGVVVQASLAETKARVLAAVREAVALRS